jgi:hypothetical protein
MTAFLLILAALAFLAWFVWNEKRRHSFPGIADSQDDDSHDQGGLIHLDEEGGGEDGEDDPYQPIITLEPRDAKPLLDALQRLEIPFVVDADHSDLADPMRPVALAYGTALPASKIIILVHKEAWSAATEIIQAYLKSLESS